MESAALVERSAGRNPSSIPTISSLARSTGRAIRRACMAACHPVALGVLVVTAVVACAVSGLGASTVAAAFMLTGAAGFAGFVLLHAVVPDRGNALYGSIGPPVEPDVLPADISPPGVRAAYNRVLTAHGKIRQSLNRRDGMVELIEEPYRRCGDLVHVAGRVARVGNALEDYIADHEADRLRTEIVGLRRRAAQATDLHARRAYLQTAEARERQLQSYEEFCGLQDRIEARLELIAASLESVQALVVKVHARLMEETAFQGEAITDGLDTLHDDLEILEQALDEALHVPVNQLTPPCSPRLH